MYFDGVLHGVALFADVSFAGSGSGHGSVSNRFRVAADASRGDASLIAATDTSGCSMVGCNDEEVTAGTETKAGMNAVSLWSASGCGGLFISQEAVIP